jgi:hypothetical protein
MRGNLLPFRNVHLGGWHDLRAAMVVADASWCAILTDRSMVLLFPQGIAAGGDESSASLHEFAIEADRPAHRRAFELANGLLTLAPAGPDNRSHLPRSLLYSARTIVPTPAGQAFG